MLKQYEKLPSGVVVQKKLKEYISAAKDYFDYYESLGVLTDQMSYLRLGYIMGVINKPNSLLDVGYGNGSFLKIASNIIPKCYGYDIQKTVLPPNVQHVHTMTNAYYDVITFFDSMEHFTDLSFLPDLKCSFVVVSVPECHYPENTEWFINWKHRKPNEHIYHFSRRALLQFMAENGNMTVAIGNVEDAIRGNLDGDSNILTGIFKKIHIQM